MLKEIISTDIFVTKAHALKQRKFRGGFDGMSMDGAAAWLSINGARLCKDILSGDYRPMPAIGFRTAKTSGGYRQLARLTAIDTVIQSVLNDILSPILDLTFNDNSMAYRTGRGVTKALERYVAYAGRHKLAVKVDVLSCYSSLDYTVLRERLNAVLDDRAFVDLLLSFAAMPVSIDGEIQFPTQGILQGMPLAPLLCNLYLDSADKFLAERNVAFIRYADDIVLFSDSLEEAQGHLDATVDFLEKALKLKCNRKKQAIASPGSMHYLGYRFTTDRKGMIAYEANSDPKTVYHSWHSARPQNEHGRVQLLSDGILRQKDFSLLFDTDSEDTCIPVASVDSINVYSDVIFDTGTLQTAMRNGITINLFDKHDSYLGSFQPSASLKAPKVTHEQLCAYYDEKRRMSLAKEFVLATIHNTLLNLRYHFKQEGLPRYKKAIDALLKIKNEVKAEAEYSKLLVIEARAKQLYYECFDLFIKRDGFLFERRSKRPPLNEVNALMSFGNTLLYSLIATEIQKTALDVRIGFLHATNKHAQSLNLDLAEIFKPLVVDRTILSLINKRELTEKHFTFGENRAVYLSAEGKRIFLQAFYEKLETTITVKDNKMSYNRIIIEEIRKLIRHFREKEKYTAFRQVR